MTITKKERSAEKALARSKRNSPSRKLTKSQQRDKREVRTKLRKRRQRITRTTQEMQRTTEALKSVGHSSEKTAVAMKNTTKVLEAMAEANRSRLSNLTVPQLQDIARDHEIKGRSKMAKPDLIDAICTFEMDRVEVEA